MTYQEVLAAARTCSGPYCKACPVCNGKACGSTMPGPGSKGTGTVAVRNYQAWQEICLNMDTICENGPVDTKFNFFGQEYDLPVFAGPVGAVNLHYGDKYNDLEYNNILVPACAQAGIAAFTGDGTNPAVFTGACEAIARSGGANLLAASGAIMSGIYVGKLLQIAAERGIDAAAGPEGKEHRGHDQDQVCVVKEHGFTNSFMILAFILPDIYEQIYHPVCFLKINRKTPRRLRRRGCFH